MWHSIFIATHAATGGAALLFGCLTFVCRTLFSVYFGTLIAMEVLLVLAIATGWTETDVPARILFAAFSVLGLVMVWRANQARRLPIGHRYLDHVGFTLVALFDAFIVILVLNFGAPVWMVAGSGILIAVAGHFALHAVHERLEGARQG